MHFTMVSAHVRWIFYSNTFRRIQVNPRTSLDLAIKGENPARQRLVGNGGEIYVGIMTSGLSDRLSCVIRP